MIKKGKEKPTIQDRVIDYMNEFDSITSLDAVRDLGNVRLSGTIFELRKKGYDIVTVDETSKNRWGDNTTYARYYFKDTYNKLLKEGKLKINREGE